MSETARIARTFYMVKAFLAIPVSLLVAYFAAGMWAEILPVVSSGASDRVEVTLTFFMAAGFFIGVYLALGSVAKAKAMKALGARSDG